MNWYLIGAAVVFLFLAKRQATEVRDGIEGDRRKSVIVEDAFFGGLYAGIGISCVIGAFLLWLNIL